MDDAEFDDLLLDFLMAAAVLFEIYDAENDNEDALGGGGEPVIWEGIVVDINDYLQMRNEAFRLHFRMTTEIFEDLVHVVGNFIGEDAIVRANEDLDLRRILLLVLWVLATPDTFRSVAVGFGVTPGVLHYHYRVIIRALSDLSERYVKWPLPEERDVIKDICQRRSGFPGVVGALDASYIPLCSAPHIEPQRYLNRHHDYAVSLQAVVDPSLVFRDIYAGEPGSLHDSRVFRRSPLSRKLLEDGTLLNQDEHILGDSAYILTDKVLTPFRNNGNLNMRQTNYNHRLSSSRSMVERAFGLLKMKWRRLFFLSARNPELVVRTIVASVVLHNFILFRGEEPDVPEVLIHDNEVIDPYPNFAHPNVRVDPDHPLLADARDRGVEKRLHVMNHLPH